VCAVVALVVTAALVLAVAVIVAAAAATATATATATAVALAVAVSSPPVALTDSTPPPLHHSPLTHPSAVQGELVLDL